MVLVILWWWLHRKYLWWLDVVVLMSGCGCIDNVSGMVYMTEAFRVVVGW